MDKITVEDYLAHSGIHGMKWGVRRYQNEDGTLTEEGKRRYLKGYASVQDNNGFKTEEDKANRLREIEFNKKNFDGEKWDKDRAETLKKDQNDYFKPRADIANEARKAVSIAADEVGRNRQGSKLINKKDYSGIPDDEMRRRINRLSMEKQYGDLTGDNKYVMTGREKAKEVLQTVGALLGIAVSAVTVAGLIHNIRQSKLSGRPKPAKK